MCYDELDIALKTYLQTMVDETEKTLAFGLQGL
jgi:hypothetical protein